MTFWDYLHRQSGKFDARFIVAMTVIGLFAWAYAENPTDDTLLGALIAGFAGAWGFYLGSAKVNQEAREQQARLIDVIEKQSPAATTEQMNVKADAVTVEKQNG